MRWLRESPVACVGAFALALSTASSLAHAQQWRQLGGFSDQVASGCYDTRRNRFVDFGLFDGVIREWTGVAWNAFEEAPPAALAGRYGYSTAYDPRRSLVYLFGGQQGFSGALYNDMWAYDGLTWRQVPVTGPSWRRKALMAFDSARDRLVLYGGENPFGLINPFDAWEFDGQQWLAAPNGPPWTPGAGLVFDAARSDMLLLADATYRLRPAGWQQIAADATTPHSRICYDSVRQRVVHYRADAPTALREWDGASWTTVLSTGVPAGDESAMWFDPVAGRSRLTPNVFGERWLWDGVSLQPDARAGIADGACWSSGPPFGGCVAFGGWSFDHAINDTWAWDGVRWTQMQPASRPTARFLASATYDAVQNRMLMFGGRTAAGLLGDLWSWDGTNWAQLATSGPPPSYAAGFTFDWVRRRAVLIPGLGAYSPTSSTWEWDGASWIAASSMFVVSPWARLAYDPIRRRTVAYDGRGPFTYEWDGSQWTNVSSPASPPRSQEIALAFDLSRGRIALVSSAPGFGLWEYDGTTWARRAGVGDYRMPAQYTAEDFALTFSFHNSRLSLHDGTRVQEVMTTPSVSDSYGAPCGDTATVLMVRAPLQLGESAFALDLAVSPGEPVLFGLSATQANVPLGGGCTVWVGALTDTVFALADARGLASWLLPVPMDPALRGLSVEAQGGALTATGAVRLSQGLHLVVGG